MLSLRFRCFVFFKQKTAYEMRIIDWSSDVCSSDLVLVRIRQHIFVPGRNAGRGRSGKSRRARDLETVPARTDLPGAGLRELAVLRVSGQGPVHVARPRADV